MIGLIIMLLEGVVVVTMGLAGKMKDGSDAVNSLDGLPLTRRDCDSIKKKSFRVAYWSNLQFVMALLPSARPRCDDDSP
jgi:hypothetical protein